MRFGNLVNTDIALVVDDMPQLRVDNRSGYDTGDLRRFFRRGIVALGVREETRVIVVPSPVRSRGCAEVGPGHGRGRLGRREGRTIVIAIAAPSWSTYDEFVRRLARLFEHEIAHKLGKTHGMMRDERLKYSEGPTPRWARGTRIRYSRGRRQK